MAEVSKKHQEQLGRIKPIVKQSYDYFKPNYDRYWDFKNFVFNTSLTKEKKDVLDDLGKPHIESNILEAHISRLMGEFAKQEPSISVSTEDGVKPTPQIAKTIDVVEGYIRHIIFDSNKNGCEYKVYEDLLGGGFSALEISTKYASPMDFDQIICMDRVYDPTLCGWDPLAMHPHKGDGRYCFKNYPKTVNEFKEEYPDVDISELRFSKADKNQGFSWSYNNEREDILIVCDFYEKKKKKIRIYKLANGEKLTEKEYKEKQRIWEEQKTTEQFPIVVDTRMTEIDIICRYRLIENKVLEYVETDFKYLPIVFVDANSKILRETAQGCIQQMTRPYVYQAKGAQELKNFAMQTLANELENMVQHKWIFPEEALPTQDDYAEAITNNQIPKVIIHKTYNPENPDQIIPSPREVVRTPVPPEVTNTFTLSDQNVQNILGAFDAALGINGNELSGKAIIEGATNSNAAAMPCVFGFMQGLNQCAQIIVDLIPKYLIGQRTIPISPKKGKKSNSPYDNYALINSPEGVSLKYPDNFLKVKVEAGVNFSVQKTRSLQLMFTAANALPIFAQFLGEECLEEVLENMELHGIDQMKAKAPAFLQKLQQMQAMQAQAQASAMQNNPMMQRNQIDMLKLQHQKEQDFVKNQLMATQQSLDEYKAETERMKVAIAQQQAKLDALISIDKSQAEKIRANVDATVSLAHEMHGHHSDMRTHDREDARLQHEIRQANKPELRENNNAGA